MVGTADGDYSAELGSEGTFKRGEHGVCVFIIHGDNVKGIVDGRVAFLVWYNVCPSGTCLRCMGEVAKFSML